MIARETWKPLKTIYERTNCSNILYLLRKLYGAKLSENGNLIKHITHILEIIDKHSTIEEIDSLICELLLCSLPPSYNTLSIVLEARPETGLNSEFINGKLTDEYYQELKTQISATVPQRRLKRKESFQMIIIKNTVHLL